MSLHLLLKAEARTLSLPAVLAMSDRDAFGLFTRLRWGDREEVACPHCGLLHRHYLRPARRIWRCAGCGDDFSVTSGTLFAHHKLPLRVDAAAALLFANAVKGLSALQLARDLGVPHKTAYVLLHKLRESLQPLASVPLEGDVHIDGGYVGGARRPENRKEDRQDRRLAENQNPHKRCIVVMRENHADNEGGVGAKRTLTFIVRKETQATLGALVPAHVAPGAVISADKDAVPRVNHSQAYRAEDGTTNNQAESYFSRFRRFHMGQVHKVGVKYLDGYANEIAYLEDSRRWSNGHIHADLLTRCAHRPTSRDWCGYWQGNKREKERLAA